MEDKNVQTVYIHDKHEIKDDGEKVQVPSLNTYGDIQNREALVEAVSREVDLDSLADEVGKDIGDVLIVDGQVEELNLYEWVLKEHGYTED
jgi:hypothetical protein